MSLYQRKNYNLKVPNIVYITLVQNTFQNTHTKNVTTAQYSGIMNYEMWTVLLIINAATKIYSLCVCMLFSFHFQQDAEMGTVPLTDSGILQSCMSWSCFPHWNGFKYFLKNIIQIYTCSQRANIIHDFL